MLAVTTTDIHYMNEDRRSKFKRLATKRTNTTINKIRLLGNLSNKSNYEYYEEDVKKIFSVVENQLKNAKAKFHIKNHNEFKL